MPNLKNRFDLISAVEHCESAYAVWLPPMKTTNPWLVKTFPCFLAILTLIDLTVMSRNCQFILVTVRLAIMLLHWVAMSSQVHLSYIHELPQEARWCKEKLDMRCLISDPYVAVPQCLPDMWSTHSPLWPNVEHPDTDNYLINKPSPFMRTSSRHTGAWRAMNNFIDGWVSKVLVHRIPHLGWENEQ